MSTLLDPPLHRLFKVVSQGRPFVLLEARLLSKQGLSFIFDRRFVRVGAINSIHASEDGLQGIVIFQRDGVEFMIMTARTMHCGAGEGRHGGAEHVIAIQQPVPIVIDEFSTPTVILRLNIESFADSLIAIQS